MINEKNIFLTVSWLSGLLSAEIFISTGEWGVQMPPLTSENSYFLRSGPQEATLVMWIWFYSWPYSWLKKTYMNGFKNQCVQTQQLTPVPALIFCLFFSRVCQMFLSFLSSFLAALLFTVHPIHAEAVSHLLTHCPLANSNTLRQRQNGRHFAHNIFKCIFFNKNAWISINSLLKCVPKGQINNIAALVQIMARRRAGDKPLSEPVVFSILTHICITLPQWVKIVISGHVLCIKFMRAFFEIAQ